MNHTLIKHCESPWPELNYESWSDTLKTLHLWTQIVGKIRLKAMPWQNHSWHTSLYINSNGLTTGSMPYKNGLFEIGFDFKEHVLVISSTFNDRVKIELGPKSVADFYTELFSELKKLGIDIRIHARPNEMVEAIPFKENHKPGHYHRQAVINYWQAAVSVHNVFQKFRSDFIGKCSPVHFFWGAFDIAVTRFSGRSAPLHPGGMPNMPLDVMQEAYSQEVSSCGFWPGGDSFPMPAFYAYAYPSHPEYGNQKVLPPAAFWSSEMGEFFLKYDDVRKASDPEKMLLSFLKSTYKAAADLAKWDRKSLEKIEIT
ncbi:MAG: DUF5996 family protein [Vicingaceae bacterium]